MGDMSSNGWGEWKRLVLQQLQDLTDAQKDTAEQIVQMKIELAKLKLKSGIWGAVAGAIPVSAAVIWYAFVRTAGN